MKLKYTLNDEHHIPISSLAIEGKTNVMINAMINRKVHNDMTLYWKQQKKNTWTFDLGEVFCALNWGILWNSV